MSNVIEGAYMVVERHQAMKVDGVLLDAYTAGAIVTVYEGLNETNQAKLAECDVIKAACICVDLCNRVGKETMH